LLGTRNRNLGAAAAAREVNLFRDSVSLLRRAPTAPVESCGDVEALCWPYFSAAECVPAPQQQQQQQQPLM